MLNCARPVPRDETRDALVAGADSTISQPIIFLVSHLPAAGVQEIFTDLAAGLRGLGFRTRLLALHDRGSTSGPPETEGQWSSVYRGKPKTAFDVIAMWRALLQEFSTTRPFAIISAMPAANVLGMLAAHVAAPDARIIVTHHSPRDTHNQFLDYADGLLGVSNRVAAIVSVSHAVSDSLMHKPSRYARKRRTIQNALPPHIENLISELSSKRAPRSSSRVVVASGRLVKQKNYPLLLRAIAMTTDVEALIVGSGDDKEQLQELSASLGVSDRVRFLGWLPRTKALQVVAAGDVFVQPSLFEGHSLGLIEAAKLGLPLIVSAVPSQVDAVTMANGTRCGLVVDPRDPAQLAQEILRVLDDRRCYAEWQARSRMLGETIRFDDMLSAYRELL